VPDAAPESGLQIVENHRALCSLAGFRDVPQGFVGLLFGVFGLSQKIQKTWKCVLTV